MSYGDARSHLRERARTASDERYTSLTFACSQAMDAQLRSAISVGAPLYNAGDVAGCATTYRVTAQQLLATNLAPVAASRLRAALQEADAAKSDAAAAWTLRHAFDALLSPATPARLEFRDTLPSGVTFKLIHDTVMGGASSGELRHDPARNTAVFAGVVSTAGGGGFASFRCSACSWPAAATGVLVVVAAGDGLQREYKCICRTDDALDGVGYQATFVAGPGAVAETHRLPFTAFRATFRGRDVPGAPQLCGSSLRCIGLMLSRFDATGKPLPSFVPGRFVLEVHALGTY